MAGTAPFDGATGMERRRTENRRKNFSGPDYAAGVRRNGKDRRSSVTKRVDEVEARRAEVMGGNATGIVDEQLKFSDAARADVASIRSGYPTDREGNIDMAAIGLPARNKEVMDLLDHPLAAPLLDAIKQATGGKGRRHGGSSSPFFQQQWVALAKTHGYGFLSGQAAKKLNEAAARLQPKRSTDTTAQNLPGDGPVYVGVIPDEATEREVLGAIVYLGMYLLAIRGKLP